MYSLRTVVNSSNEFNFCHIEVVEVVNFIEVGNENIFSLMLPFFQKNLSSSCYFRISKNFLFHKVIFIIFKYFNKVFLDENFLYTLT